MREIQINLNDSGQRIDRFLKKYLNNAGSSIIQKYLRTKKIKVNKKKVNSSYMLNENDIINIYIYEEELNKLITEKNRKRNYCKKLNIIFEDKNIIVMNKPVGLLSHASSKEDYGKNLVDYMIGYLIDTGEYVPRIERTFVPSIINRLDRNTSGIVIGAKNAMSLRELNKLKHNSIQKFYKTIVKGKVNNDFIISDKLLKNEERNKSIISKKGKEAFTEVVVEKTTNDFSLLSIRLLTGRTHQIRIHLSSKNLPIIGDEKYGDYNVNKIFKKDFGLTSQFLHADSIKFGEINGELSYLNDKVFHADMDYKYEKILKDLFDI